MSDSKLSRLHPMAIGLLSLKKQEKPMSHFVYLASTMIENRPEKLTDKWIEGINNWCEKILIGMELQESGEFSIDDVVRLQRVLVVKRRARKCGDAPALITEDSRGWRYWMIWPEAFEFNVGDVVDIDGVVRDIKDGMVFLRRPSSVRVSEIKGK